MTRCYAEPGAWEGERVRLAEAEAHHLARVLRLGPGAEVEVFDGAGRFATAVLAQIERRGADLRILRVGQEPETAPRRVLLQGIPKGHRADWIVQKAVELGMAGVRIVESEHAVVRLSRERRASRERRLRQAAVQAAKQCGRSRLPALSLFDSVAAAVAARETDESWLLCSLAPEARPIGPVVRERLRSGAPAFVVAVGPEGDFSVAEGEALRAAGAAPVRLGPWTLRAETAAIYAMSVLSHECLGLQV